MIDSATDDAIKEALEAKLMRAVEVRAPSPFYTGEAYYWEETNPSTVEVTIQSESRANEYIHVPLAMKDTELEQDI
jgi:hypothetical protein